MRSKMATFIPLPCFPRVSMVHELRPYHSRFSLDWERPRGRRSCLYAALSEEHSLQRSGQSESGCVSGSASSASWRFRVASIFSPGSFLTSSVFKLLSAELQFLRRRYTLHEPFVQNILGRPVYLEDVVLSTILLLGVGDLQLPQIFRRHIGGLPLKKPQCISRFLRAR